MFGKYPSGWNKGIVGTGADVHIADKFKISQNAKSVRLELVTQNKTMKIKTSNNFNFSIFNISNFYKNWCLLSCL